MQRLPFPDPSVEENEWIQRLKVQRKGRFVNVFRQLSHNPQGAFTVSEVGVFLREGTVLPETLRELAVLCVAVVNQCDYEWSHHVAIARRVGLRDEAIKAAATGDDSELSEVERAVADYARSVGKTCRVDGEVFERLGAGLSEREIVELATTVGYYSMIARILVPFEVPLDDFAELLPAGQMDS